MPGSWTIVMLIAAAAPSQIAMEKEKKKKTEKNTVKCFGKGMEVILDF